MLVPCRSVMQRARLLGAEAAQQRQDLLAALRSRRLQRQRLQALPGLRRGARPRLPPALRPLLLAPRLLASLPQLSPGALAESVSLPRTEPVEEW